MKKIKWVHAGLLGIVIAFFSMQSIGAEARRAWMISACYKFDLAAWDKFEGKAATAKFIITSSKGRVFIAERTATGDSNTASVIFPDDFRDAKVLGVSASVDCFFGEQYTWEVYVDNVLIDGGTIGFTRNNPRNKPQNKHK